MFENSQIELSRSALKNNLRFIRKQIGPKVRFCSVVKGNAYGHGFDEFLPMAHELGVDYFGFYSADEAYDALQIIDPHCQLLIMGMVEDDAIDWAIENDIEFFVFGLKRLEAAIQSAQKLNKPAKIHLEVETGMNRTGIDPDEVKLTLHLIKNYRKWLEVKGCCTHFAGAESISNYVRIQNQIKTFKRFRTRLKRNKIQPEHFHTACSAAIIAYPESIMDMVRVGILQYGFWPSEETKIRYLTSKNKSRDPLKRVISWKSRVMSVKYIKKGEYIGYGSSFMANKNMKVVVVPVGYAHGYSRSLSNYGRVLIRGRRLNVVGVVNMNAIMVDTTDLANVEKGDEVVLIGKQGKRSISVASFSELSNQLNYEMLARLPLQIPRKIVK